MLTERLTTAAAVKVLGEGCTSPASSLPRSADGLAGSTETLDSWELIGSSSSDVSCSLSQVSGLELAQAALG